MSDERPLIVFAKIFTGQGGVAVRQHLTRSRRWGCMVEILKSLLEEHACFLSFILMFAPPRAKRQKFFAPLGKTPLLSRGRD
jgi:hypothetical protein